MTNRIDEADAFNDFCEIDRTLSLSHFIHDDQPDFQHLTGSLGIELVWYRRDATEHREGGSPHREWEVNLEKLLGRVRSEYEAAYSWRLDVFVHPRPGCRVSFSKGVQTDLLNLIISTAAGTRESVPPSLLPMIEGVTASPVPDWYKGNSWQMVSANFVNVRISAVQACLDEKERKVPIYRQSLAEIQKRRSKCDDQVPEVWLLVHGSSGVVVGAREHGRWSTSGRVTEDLLRTTFRSSFDRVYYLDQDQRLCERLTVERPT